MSWPVSVQICTLNEAANIEECLNAVYKNNPAEVLVIDGGSTDGTPDIARSLGAHVLEMGRVGLARQRREGYLQSTQIYTAFVDADDRLSPDWLESMLAEFEAGDYSALQSLLRVPTPHNFWTRGWDVYFQDSIKTTSDSIMVGRPSLFRTDALLGISGTSGMIVEDTEMSRDFQLRGLRQGIGSAISYRYCPDSAEQNASKWRGYGKGYRQFASANPDRFGAIIRHIVWTIPVSRGFRPLLRGKWQQPSFAAFMGFHVLSGFLGKPPKNEIVY